MSNLIQQKYLPGDTIQFTWVSSNTTLTSGYAAVYDRNEILVSSSTLTDSGNGHYYADYTTSVGSDGYYVVELSGNINSLPRKRRIRFKVADVEVD
jgi:hypothetical protein